MKTLTILATTALSTTLAAQHTVQARTHTDYGVLAQSGAAQGFRSIDAGTPVGQGLHVAARAGMMMHAPMAATSVDWTGSWQHGVGIRVAERGMAASDDPNASIRVGTSPSNQNARMPVFGPHAVRVAFAAMPRMRGHLIAVWYGGTDGRARAGFGIDADGDGVPDLSGQANGTRNVARLAVTAGMNGVVADLVTDAHAGLAGSGHSGYQLAVELYFQGDGMGGGCTFTPFGAECAGKLTGSSNSTMMGHEVVLSLTGAAPNALGGWVLGDALARPVTLPASRCQLLVDPTVLLSLRTDGNGDARTRIPMRTGMLADVDTQAITLAITATGVTLGSSNGLTVQCR